MKREASLVKREAQQARETSFVRRDSEKLSAIGYQLSAISSS
jgi:hypothetical protein